MLNLFRTKRESRKNQNLLEEILETARKINPGAYELSRSDRFICLQPIMGVDSDSRGPTQTEVEEFTRVLEIRLSEKLPESDLRVTAESASRSSFATFATFVEILS